MSRIGREPIAIPAGVTVTIAENNLVTVKGPLGELQEKFTEILTIAQEGSTLTVTRPNDEKEVRALHGLTRTLVNNMVVGVTKGYEKKLEIVGVGYRVEKPNFVLWTMLFLQAISLSTQLKQWLTSIKKLQPIS